MDEVNSHVTTLKEGLKDTKTGQSNETFISALSLQRRRHSATNVEDGKMSVRTKRRRVQETYEAAIQINGATKENHQPALEGIVEVLNTKFSNLASTLSKKNILAKTVTCNFHKDQCVSYEKTDENMLRSIDVYYAMGVMGKRKYIKVRQSLSFKKVKSKYKKTERIKLKLLTVPYLPLFPTINL